ncbi:MAG: 3'(2'),5'-bisphosphate nucleotidase CysQ [Caulobacteraceae bacterium]
MSGSDLDLLRGAAVEAGRLALSIRKSGLEVAAKLGGSPVTNGDLAVDEWLTQTLRGARPDYGWLSEETADNPQRLQARRVFIVDPIDGTTAYVGGRPWWAVSVAVVEDGRTIAGVVHAPELDETYEAAIGGGACLNGEPINASARAVLADCNMVADPQVFAPRQGWPAWPPMIVTRRNAIAYRMSLVAGGGFDATVSFTPKSDWDLAAAALIAEEAGARVTDHHGQPLRFNSAAAQNPGLVCAAPALHPLILALAAPIDAQSTK